MKDSDIGPVLFETAPLPDKITNLAERIGELEENIDFLFSSWGAAQEKRIAALEDALSEPLAPESQVPYFIDHEQRISALETKVAGIIDNLETGLAQTLNKIADSISALEAENEKVWQQFKWLQEEHRKQRAVNKAILAHLERPLDETRLMTLAKVLRASIGEPDRKSSE